MDERLGIYAEYFKDCRWPAEWTDKFPRLEQEVQNQILQDSDVHSLLIEIIFRSFSKLSPQSQLLISRHPELTRSSQMELTKSTESIKLSLLENRNLNLQVLERLASDDSEAVREAVKTHPLCSQELALKAEAPLGYLEISQTLYASDFFEKNKTLEDFKTNLASVADNRLYVKLHEHYQKPSFGSYLVRINKDHTLSMMDANWDSSD